SRGPGHFRPSSSPPRCAHHGAMSTIDGPETGIVATLLTPEAADAMAWHPPPPHEGVAYKLSWRSGKSVAGPLRLQPGPRPERHAHRASHHLMWMVAGGAQLRGRPVGPGTYVHIPAGIEHGLEAGDEGCTLVYLYLREPGYEGSAG